MSDTSPQPVSRRAERRAERRAVRQGQKMLKAGYALAAANAKRLDPAIREQIGRAGLTKADLQMLASSAVDARFRPQQYGAFSQQVGEAARARLAQAGPAPTNNWFTRHNRYSRWRRNERAGTKALKQALTQAARDVKKTDPAVLAAIGRSQFNSLDLAALAAGRVGQAFQQQGQRAAQQGQGPQVQAPQEGQVPQAPAPQQGQGPQLQAPTVNQQAPSLTQQIAALQQTIQAQQQRTLELMAESNRLQAQMQQLIQARAAQLQQEVVNLNALQGQMAQMNRQFNQQLAQQANIDPNLQPAQGQQPEQQAPAPQQENTDDHVRLDNPVVPTDEGLQTPEGEGQALGGQSGEQQAEGTGAQVEGAEPQVQSAEPQVQGAEPQVQGARPAQAAQADLGERWTARSENPGAHWEDEAAQTTDGQPGAERHETEAQQPTSEGAEPKVTAQQPGTTPQQPAVNANAAQQPGTNPQQPAVSADADRLSQGVGASEKSAAELDSEFAHNIALGAQKPLSSTSSPQQAEDGGRSNGEDPNRRQRSTQGPARNAPSGKEGR